DSASAADFDALLSKIEDAGPQALQLVLEEQLALMKSEGKHEEALELAKKVAELNIGKEGVAYDEMHIGKEGVAYDEMNAQLEHLQEEMDEYTASMDAANTAFAEGDETAEEEALFKALETFPNDRKATRKLSQTSKRFAIAWDEVEPELKRWNADQKEWHVTLYRDALGLELDISGHDNLAFINPLKNLPIDRLDIRHTKVRDLSPATGMYLSGIWCDHSEVTDLEPLRNEPLQVLSIMDTAVNDFEIVPSLTFLNVLCVDPKHEIPMCIPYPSKHQMWENAIGVRFIPAVGTGHLMSSREITQHHYANFAIAASSEIMTEEDRTEFKKEATLHPMMLDLTEALSFCEWLTKRDQKAGHLLLGGIYRLPDPRELAALQKHVSTAGAEEGAQSVISQKVGPVAEGPCQRGFFDVLGNAEEWEISYGDLQIFNSRRTYPKGLDAKTKRAIRLVLDLSDARLSTPIPQVVTKTIEEEGS
ncbi:MAG: tetratricopeptide (TPR) repeat protein, partial [Verrucomicrobiales bacterium]